MPKEENITQVLKIRCLREYCDWEGESWNFYIKMTDTQYEDLQKLIKNSAFTLKTKEYTEEEVRILIANTNSGYMDYENYMGFLKELPSKEEFDKHNVFYKGQIFNYCEKEDL